MVFGFAPDYVSPTIMAANPDKSGQQATRSEPSLPRMDPLGRVRVYRGCDVQSDCRSGALLCLIRSHSVAHSPPSISLLRLIGGVQELSSGGLVGCDIGEYGAADEG